MVSSARFYFQEILKSDKNIENRDSGISGFPHPQTGDICVYVCMGVYVVSGTRQSMDNYSFE